MKFYKCNHCECECTMKMPEKIANEHIEHFGNVQVPDVCLASGEEGECDWKEVGND